MSAAIRLSALAEASKDSILSAPRGVRVEELGLYPAGGRTPCFDQLAAASALLLAYAVLLVALVLAVGCFFFGRPLGAAVACAAGAVAFYLVLKGEAALDAQAFDEFEG